MTVVPDHPTRDGDREVHLLTNLPRTKAAADVYRRRWTIEGRFPEVARTFNAEPRTPAYPSAALFAFCLGLVASNAAAVLKAVVRAEHGPAVPDGVVGVLHAPGHPAWTVEHSG